MNYSKIFFYSCLSFIIGVFIASITAVNFFYIYLILLFSILLLILSLRNKYFLVLGLWGIFLFLGIWRYQLSLPGSSNREISFYNGQEIAFRGIVDKEPDQREDKVRLEIKADSLMIDKEQRKIRGKVLVTNYLFPEYNYGDNLEIKCKLIQPEKINDFAYDDYLARYDIYSLCYQPKITLLKQNQGNYILASIFNLKSYFIGQINKVLAEPQSSFLAGLLIGAKRAIPADLQTAFSKTGTTHIVAVSGYNVTIIVVFLMLIFLKFGLGRKKSFWIIIGFLICFAILTGLQSSCIRAAIMGVVVLLANYLGRLSKIKNVLVLAVVLMLLANPKILVFDLGFQLSFLATLGLVYLNPVLVSLFRLDKIKNKFLKVVCGDYLATTMSAIIFTQPLILNKFGKISLIAPVANILVLPFIPLAMLLGFITGILAMLWPSLGWVAGWSIWLVLTYIIWVLENLASLNWAYFELPKISVWVMAILYLLILACIKIKPRCK